MAKTKKTTKEQKPIKAVVEAVEPVTAPVEQAVVETSAEQTQEVQQTQEAVEAQETTETQEIKAKKQPKFRSKRYLAAKAYVDRTKTYPVSQAVALVKKTQYTKFPGTVEAHLVLRAETSAEVTFPYSTGKTVRVAIANDELLKQVEQGVITFDILVAKPDMMPKLAKLARVLGPKGLMPNPKNGTISPDPEKRKKELEGGRTTVRTEKKAPLMHIVLGKTSQPEQELEENLNALLKALPSGSVLKCVLCATMGPGIKVSL